MLKESECDIFVANKYLGDFNFSCEDCLQSFKNMSYVGQLYETIHIDCWILITNIFSTSPVASERVALTTNL